MYSPKFNQVTDRALLLELGEFRRVVEPPAQVGADQPDGDTEEEWQPPTPGEER